MLNINTEQFIEIIHLAVEEAVADDTVWNKLTSADEQLSALGLDSLDMLITFVTLSNLVPVPENVWKQHEHIQSSETTVQQLIDFVDEHRTEDIDTTSLS